ncbi:hypothetical protein GCM10009116_13100 [Brevundimonas basaltis]|uniref:DUF2059 domain-containing protein n=1 Tax=Brevundimonas basaltis TaxID=472166 RepID=A0A7W8HYQ4_9CAUL|nr:DUF2059 domain-containing protein [Brevundimonas basaltis]MBB5291377.1 hypothetical protein [Brevundimonas basaltis]
MRFKIAFMAAALMAGGLSAPAALASVASQDVTAAPTARQLELTRRYIDLTMTEQFEDSLRQMIMAQAEIDPGARGLPDEERRFIAELSADLTADMIPQMLEAMTPVYARIFTEAELEAVIAFYDSELGKSIIEKTMTVMPEAHAAAMTVMPQLMDKMAARMCQHYGCDAGELRAMQGAIRGEVPVAPRRK